MDTWIAILTISCIVATIFVATHLGPLDDSQIKSLAAKRRKVSIRRYFTYSHQSAMVDANFKKRMRADGKFYEFSESIFAFPSVSAGLLKGKKHEWIIIALEKNGQIELVWTNKGFDSVSVSAFIDPTKIAELALNRGSTSVLVFHNHPNPDPRRLDCSRPSEQDIKVASIWAKEVCPKGLNLLKFVCERGLSYEYARFIADEFQPVEMFVSNVEKINGLSKLRNLSLHCERMF